MEAIDELIQLSESMMQAFALLSDEDIGEKSSRRSSTFLNVVTFGNVGAGKSAVMNSLIGHPVLPTGENGATRAPISIDLQRDDSLSSKSIVLQIDSKSQQVSANALRHSLQDKLSKGSGRSRGDEIYLKLCTSTAPPLKLVDLPGLDQRAMDESVVTDYAARNDAIILVVIPAAQAPEISSSRALRLAKEFDAEATRTVGVISKIDQAAGDQKALSAAQALLLSQGPPKASDIPWVALIGQSVSLASAHAGSLGSENSLEAAWQAETESLKSILPGIPQSKLGRLSLMDTLAKQIRSRMKLRLPNLLSGLQGKSQIVHDELFRLGEQMVHSSEGTRAIALELCREFEDKFLLHISSGEETMTRRPADPEEELRWMSQEVRGYVEAVLNSLAANVPKAVVLCQVEKAKEEMLNQLYSSVSAQSTPRIEELLQEDQNVKQKRERYQRHSSILSKLTRALSIHDNRVAAATWSESSSVAESSPRSSGPPGDEWRTAFDNAAAGPTSKSPNARSNSANGSSRRYSDHPSQNVETSSGSNSGGRRTPVRLPPVPPPANNSSVYKY